MKRILLREYVKGFQLPGIMLTVGYLNHRDVTSPNCQQDSCNLQEPVFEGWKLVAFDPFVSLRSNTFSNPIFDWALLLISTPTFGWEEVFGKSLLTMSETNDKQGRRQWSRELDERK